MFATILKAATLVCGVSALTTPHKEVQKRVDGVPVSGGISVNGVAFGFLPSDSSGTSPTYTMAQIDSTLGGKASTYGWYSQISSSSSYSGSQLLEVLDDVVSSGAIFQPAIMPTVGFSGITPSIASQVASVLEQFTEKGVEVWLRFGHEMNYYVTDNPPTYTGTPAEFITAWQNIHAAVSSNPLIKMWWSPNIPVSTANQYFPGASYVDIVGIDCYPGSPLSSTAFSDCYSEFYSMYSSSSGYNIPFAIGETGYADDDGDNDQWLSQLVGQDMSDYPNYIAASWFEYSKQGADFRIVMGSSSILAETQSILLNGGTDPSGGGGSTYPADTCTWGCEGWSCSSSSPCQSAYSCDGGYCSDCTWGCNGWSCSSSSPCNADYTCVSGYCHHSGPATK